MTAEPRSSLERVELTLTLGDNVVDLATRALVMAVVPMPTWGREAEVLAGVRGAADSRTDLVEVPAEPRLLGPAAAAVGIPVAAQVSSAAQAAAAREAGAEALLVPAEHLADVVRCHVHAQGGQAQGDDRVQQPTDCPLAVLVARARDVPDMRGNQTATGLPIALDTVGLTGVDLVAETSLALTVGARIVRTTDVRRARRIVEVMAALLEARGGAPQ